MVILTLQILAHCLEVKMQVSGDWRALPVTHPQLAPTPFTEIATSQSS